MAQKAVEIGYEIMNGKKPAEPMILMPSQLITARQRQGLQGLVRPALTPRIRRRPGRPGRRRRLRFAREPSAMAEVVCFGDLLIDFVPTVTGTGLADAPAFVKAPGGAAANVAVGLARLGVASAFMGKVGDDPFGHFLADTLAAEGVDVGAFALRAVGRAPRWPSSRCAPTASASSCSTATPAPTCCSRPTRSTTAAIRAARVFHFDSISLASRAAARHGAASRPTWRRPPAA